MSAARLAALIRERQPCVVLTGAGVSTESGIPDFRSPGGLWEELDPYDFASLEVHPVAGLPLETLGAGGAPAVVNLGPTALDARATLKLDGGAGEILLRVVAELG